MGAGDVAWALGHVVSRAFGGGDDVALAPLVDSCNHRGGAGKPFALPSGVALAGAAAAGEGDGQGQGGGEGGGEGTLVCVAPPPGGLRAGEELCIAYGGLEGGDGREAPLSLLLNFGFLPRGVQLE